MANAINTSNWSAKCSLTQAANFNSFARLFEAASAASFPIVVNDLLFTNALPPNIQLFDDNAISWISKAVDGVPFPFDVSDCVCEISQGDSLAKYAEAYL